MRRPTGPLGPIAAIAWVVVMAGVGASGCGGDDARPGDSVSGDTGAVDADSDVEDSNTPDSDEGDAGDTDSSAPPIPEPPPLSDSARLLIDSGEVQVQPTLAISGDTLLSAWTAKQGEELGIFAGSWDLSSTKLPVLRAASRVNTDLRGLANEPAACTRAGGGFVVAWSQDTQEAGPDGENLNVRFRLLGADGSPASGATSDVRVYTERPGNHWLADVACDPRGGFVVAGVRPSLQAGFEIFFQRYDVAGVKVGPAVAVDPIGMAGSQGFPAVGVDGQGNVVVAYEHDDDDVTEIRGRVVSTGDELGPTITLRTGDGLAQARVSVGPDSGIWAGFGFADSQVAGVRVEGAQTSPIEVTATGIASGVGVTPVTPETGGAARPAHLMSHFIGSGAAVTVSARYIAPDGTVGAAVALATGSFPLAYSTSAAYGAGRAAVAWTESLGGGSFVNHIVVFGAGVGR